MPASHRKTYRGRGREGMETRVRLVRWLRLVTAAMAAGLTILALMILPDLVGFLPCAIPGSPLEWSAVALVVVFRGEPDFPIGFS
jgi:hypothetical protein